MNKFSYLLVLSITALAQCLILVIVSTIANIIGGIFILLVTPIKIAIDTYKEARIMASEKFKDEK